MLRASTGADYAGRQKIPIFLPTCAPAQGLHQPPSFLQLRLICPLAAGRDQTLAGEGLVGSRLASAVAPATGRAAREDRGR